MMKQSAESIAHRRLMAETPEFGIGNAECGKKKIRQMFLNSDLEFRI